MLKLNKEECRFIGSILNFDTIHNFASQQARDCAIKEEDYNKVIAAYELIAKVLHEAGDDDRAGRWSPNIDLSYAKLSERITKKHTKKKKVPAMS